MSETPPPPVTVADSEILAGLILPGVKAIREHLGCSLHEALRAFHERYEVLQREQPEAFVVAPGEYWSGFYS
ncbi:hypothetical protein [Streptomyces sp. NPDC046685]|uniref:hypothetical protein n=1 Tax=Streptomyces sp. NPDC046685 TaxID=3157202 RepID=UPI0033C22A6D